MKNEIIQDYSKTIVAEMYLRILQEHLYIWQADQCIRNIVRNHCQKNSDDWRKILDVGCGPGRLTSSLGSRKDYRIGIDLSADFIEYACEISRAVHPHDLDPNLDFKVVDFATNQNIKLGVTDVDLQECDVIVMQGVMHHIHDKDRTRFLQRSFDLLKPDGILIIGDEFIKEYDTEEKRVFNVAKFYLHIIDEARKGDFDELAEEEAKNLIDDCFSGTENAGLATEKTFEHIYQYAAVINKMFYEYGAIAGLNFEADNQIRSMFNYIKRSVEHLIGSSSENFNRGDLKVSIQRFINELADYGFSVRGFVKKIGPVDELGGMAVIVFEKA